MKVSHKLTKISMSKDDCSSSTIMLSDKHGCFLMLPEKSKSKYDGFFLNDGLSVYRMLENIGILDSAFEEVENHLTHVRRIHAGNTERIEVPEKSCAIRYTLLKKAKIFIDLDCRKAYDMRSLGRYYEVSVDNKTIIIRFDKKTDEKEDSTSGVDEYRLYIAIKPKIFDAKKDYKFVDQWTEHDYHYDLERKDLPASRYVYRPFIITAKELLIGFGTTQDAAMDAVERIEKQDLLKREFRCIKSRKDDIAAAFICAQDALDKLKVSHEGMTRLYAGLPWFFQLWSRDELISIGSWIKLRQYRKVKETLLNYISSIGPDGRLANRLPSSDLASADGIGWLWKRVSDFVDALYADKIFDEYFNEKELEDIIAALRRSIDNIEQRYMKDGLVGNGPKETWMDTDWEGKDNRAGSRIEIQALHLNMLHLMHALSSDSSYEARERALREKAREGFWNGRMLADGVEDFVQRPNIFIAYYAYPDLLSRSEWEACFDFCLEKIWLDWGGVSSIAKDHALFTKDYTGIDNQSYHRGDSWFWINSIVALCLVRNNAIHFEDKILAILKASSQEILWKGAIGHHAELSSASVISSKGCLAQAWSAAMFIEAVMEAYETV